MRRFVPGALVRLGFSVAIIVAVISTVCAKEAGVFYPPELIAKAKVNIARSPWAAEQRKLVLSAADRWVKLSDDDLWDLMFGPTIHRSWHVLSDGFCPSCKQGTPMYAWIFDAMNQPWKARCPHCKMLFPTNDFAAYYRSGLDDRGIFDAAKADKSLLVNTAHPDPNDPLHTFGVDDGTGYKEGDKRWQFVSTYLIYGQWKQAVLGGIRNLASAYVVSGDRKYAHKAGVMLDRVADLYPTFDFNTQADLYDGRNQGAGYVSVWHDACEEARELAMGYDMIFDGIKGDKKLVEFLSRKAREHKLENRKSSFADIERNIEDRILRDTLANEPKITSNFPRTQLTMMLIRSVLGGPENRKAFDSLFDWTMEKATEVDGVTGEKGLVDYSAHVIKGVAMFLAQHSRIDPDFLRDAMKKHPRIHDMYRFHIDTWCLGKYYPLVGDAGWFGCQRDYMGVDFFKGFDSNPSMYGFSLSPSMFTFLWQLYELTGDKAFVQVLHHANGDSVDGLPYDLFADDPQAFQQDVHKIVASTGPMPKVGNVNKQKWHLAILRSGKDADARALWMQYDAWGGHGHANCMEIGLFAKGLDLLPDFGYKPVNYGGWSAPKAVWYGKTAAHNTVVVNGRDQGNGAGVTTLWAEGKAFRAIRASGPGCMGGKQFERTAALVDISDKDCYVLDVFRVIGGTDHAKFTGSHFGTVTTEGLNLQPTGDYGYGTEMRNFRWDPSPKPGWSVDWRIEDKYKFLPSGSDVHFRYTDLTTGVRAHIAEAWISYGGYYNSFTDTWIPRIVSRHMEKDEPHLTNFVSIMEPYEGKSNIAKISRLPLETPEGMRYSDMNAAVEIRLADGRRDLLISADIENPLGLKPARGVMVQKDWNVRTDAELCMVRLDAAGRPESAVVCKGSFLAIGDKETRLEAGRECSETIFPADKE